MIQVLQKFNFVFGIKKLKVKKDGWEGTMQKIVLLYVTLCAICYHLYNLENVKNTDGIMLLFKLQAKACNFTIVAFLHGYFSRFKFA